MPLYYPAPNITNAIGLITYNDSVTNNLFSPFLLIMIFSIVFLSTNQRNTIYSLMVASFITTISSYLLVAMGALNPTYSIVLTLLTAIFGALGLHERNSGRT